MKRIACLLFAALAACGGAPAAAELGAPPDVDAGGELAPDAGAVPGPDQGVPAPDSRPPPTGPDAGPDPLPDAAPSLPDSDAAPPEPDAAGGDVDAGTGPAPVCSSPDPDCARAVAIDDAIRAQFPSTRYSCTEGARKCGEINDRGTPVTYPMVCRDSAWRLAGTFVGGSWLPLYMCSMGCGGIGNICDP